MIAQAGHILEYLPPYSPDLNPIEHKWAQAKAIGRKTGKSAEQIFESELCGARADWFTHRVPAISAMPERVVFLDETSVKTNLTRLRGRSLRGTRLTASAPFGSWGTQTLIAGLGPSDLIAPWVVKGAMDGPAFVAYIRDVLIPRSSPAPP